ncbi:MAG: outer membrane protein assembly factor BamE [Thermoanaerobaculia bacterium]|nr:outer membrane protein assembly factor BamE [Thermoanaerobaculia bacterium]
MMRWRAVSSQEALLPSAVSRFLVTLSLAAACLMTLPLVGCGSSDSGADDPSAALWTEVQQMQSALAATRTQIADAREKLQAASEGAAEEGEEAAEEGAEAEAEAEAGPTVEELEAEIAQLEDSAVSQAEEFTTKVIQFINESGIVEGQPLTAEQRQAFDWKAEEDIRIAQEYIDKGGDYSRAIDIYNASLMSDSENQALLDAKAEAERLQYMTEERFAAVEKGMTQEEVRALIGTVNNRNVREYEEEGTVGWFYRREDGGAAGVFFKEKNGELLVAVVDFDAAKPPSASEESSE